MIVLKKILCLAVLSLIVASCVTPTKNAEVKLSGYKLGELRPEFYLIKDTNQTTKRKVGLIIFEFSKPVAATINAKDFQISYPNGMGKDIVKKSSNFTFCEVRNSRDSVKVKAFALTDMSDFKEEAYSTESIKLEYNDGDNKSVSLSDIDKRFAKDAIVLIPDISIVSNNKVLFSGYSIRLRTPAKEYLPSGENFRVQIGAAKGSTLWNSGYGAMFTAALAKVLPENIGDAAKYETIWEGKSNEGFAVETGLYRMSATVPSIPLPYLTMFEFYWEKK